MRLNLRLRSDKVPGTWVEISLSVLGGDLSGFEQGMFHIPRLRQELINLGCSAYGNYLEGAYVNEENQSEMILEVHCAFETAYLHIEGFPPFYVESFDYKPIDPVALYN